MRRPLLLGTANSADQTAQDDLYRDLSRHSRRCDNVAKLSRAGVAEATAEKIEG